MTKKFDPQIGDIVDFYPEGDVDCKPHPAIVTSIGHDTVTVNIVAPDLKNFQIKDGVHHISDPRCRRVETRDNGGWDHTPRMKSILELLS